MSAVATDLEWVTPAVRAPGLEHLTFESAAAGTRVSYHILVPEAYGAEEGLRFPVLYWLHGGGGSDGRAVVGGIAPMAARFGGAMRGGQIAPMLVVFPNGMHSLWLDSRDGRIPMETVLIKELVPHIDATFRTIASREGRIIEGFSMGGYGAAHLGFKYPEVFGSVSILSGGPLQREFDEAPRVGPRGRERVMGGIFGGDPEYFRAESPWVLAGQHADALRERTLIRVVIGDRDEMLANVRDFSSRLSSLRIPHGHVELPGVGHDPVAVLDALGEENWRFYHAAVGAGGARAVPGESRSGPGKSSSSGGTIAVPKIENFRLDGERWTCAAAGEPLGGIFMKPEGEGPFAGIVLSHGLGAHGERPPRAGVGHNLPNDRAEEVNRLMRDWFLRRGVLREAAGQRPAAQGE